MSRDVCVYCEEMRVLRGGGGGGGGGEQEHARSCVDVDARGSTALASINY
jgi:hypothetical protein